MLPMPNYLPKEAKPIWDREVKALQDMRIISEKDIPAVAEMVSHLHTIELANEDIKLYGRLIKTNTGGLSRNPAYSTRREAYAFVLQYRKEFGLTPLSEQRMDKPPEEESGHPDDNLY